MSNCKARNVTKTGTHCRDDKICNPDTGRCVNRDGKIGSNVMKLWTDMEKKSKRNHSKSPKNKSPIVVHKLSLRVAETPGVSIVGKDWQEGDRCRSKTTTANGKSC